MIFYSWKNKRKFEKIAEGEAKLIIWYYRKEREREGERERERGEGGNSLKKIIYLID